MPSNEEKFFAIAAAQEGRGSQNPDLSSAPAKPSVLPKVALWSSVLSIITCGLLSPISFVISIIALLKTRASESSAQRRLAFIGLVVSVLPVVPWTLFAYQSKKDEKVRVQAISAARVKAKEVELAKIQSFNKVSAQLFPFLLKSGIQDQLFKKEFTDGSKDLLNQIIRAESGDVASLSNHGEEGHFGIGLSNIDNADIANSKVVIGTLENKYIRKKDKWVIERKTEFETDKQYSSRVEQQAQQYANERIKFQNELVAYLNFSDGQSIEVQIRDCKVGNGQELHGIINLGKYDAEHQLYEMEYRAYYKAPITKLLMTTCFGGDKAFFDWNILNQGGLKTSEIVRAHLDGLRSNPFLSNSPPSHNSNVVVVVAKVEVNIDPESAKFLNAHPQSATASLVYAPKAFSFFSKKVQDSRDYDLSGVRKVAGDDGLLHYDKKELNARILKELNADNERSASTIECVCIVASVSEGMLILNQKSYPIKARTAQP